MRPCHAFTFGGQTRNSDKNTAKACSFLLDLKAADRVNAKPATPLLDKVKVPADLRLLSESDLPQLAAELRAELIDAVSLTGGHLGAGLGVVELTVALASCFRHA